MLEKNRLSKYLSNKVGKRDYRTSEER